MPTVITHAVVALSAGKAISDTRMPARFWLSCVACATIPDADVMAFLYGIPYGAFFGHRGFFHSIFFALIFSICLSLVFFRKEEPLFSCGWWRLFIFFFVIGASHGILDAFTDGGLGIALLSPFDTHRYFFPWTPIPVSPIGINAFLSRWGFHVLVAEIIFLWLPMIFLSFGFHIVRHRLNLKIDHPPPRKRDA